MEMEIVFLVEIEEQIANCSLRSRGKNQRTYFIAYLFCMILSITGRLGNFIFRKGGLVVLEFGWDWSQKE